MPTETDLTDDALLQQFIEDRSHAAFAALVRRHVDTVYNAARRQVSDPALAEDVSQAVFIILARKAASLSPDVILVGWLVKTAHLAARDALKSATRRRNHEQRYAAMSPTQTSPSTTTSAVFADELSSDIDRALAKLNDTDRGAIVLRYLQGRSVAQVATALRVTEETATKRLHRALVKLRSYFARHPITPSIAGLATALQQLPHVAAPSSLAHTAVTAALGGASAATLSSAPIARAAMKTMFWAHAKAAAATLAATIIAVVAAVGTVSRVRAQAAGDSTGSFAIKVPASPAATPSTVPSPATAPTTMPHGLTAHLVNGIAVELIGVSESPSTGKPWWGADGKPLDAAPYWTMTGPHPPNVMLPHAEMREFAARIANLPAGDNGEPASARWHPMGGDGGGVIAPPRDKARQVIRGMEARAFILPAFDPIDIRFEFATGPWQTLVESGLDGNRQTHDGATYEIRKPVAVKDTTHFEFVSANQPLGYTRMVVEDVDGKLQNPNSVRVQWGVKGATQEFALPIPLARIKRVRVESRPFDQWITFKNVCVDPKNPTKVKIETSDETQGL